MPTRGFRRSLGTGKSLSFSRRLALSIAAGERAGGNVRDERRQPRRPPRGNPGIFAFQTLGPRNGVPRQYLPGKDVQTEVSVLKRGSIFLVAGREWRCRLLQRRSENEAMSFSCMYGPDAFCKLLVRDVEMVCTHVSGSQLDDSRSTPAALMRSAHPGLSKTAACLKEQPARKTGFRMLVQPISSSLLRSFANQRWWYSPLKTVCLRRGAW
jgi:hypothetical protein